MFKNIVKCIGSVNSVLFKKLPCSVPNSSSIQALKFHSLNKHAANLVVPTMSLETITNALMIKSQNIVQSQQTRSNSAHTVIKYSKDKGIRLSEPEVQKRFFRLDWGMWIRTKCGRHKKMFKKSMIQRRRLKYHVMCNANQCNLLDKMVNNQFKVKRYFVDDPYEPYHTREDFPMTARKPRPLPETANFVDTSP
uniref:Large ribosomal subunit protein bL35m n=1 Tax=Cacopsylla melanoneura TaxID=428564 RepID=A0A8D8W1T7_9HEMI